MGPLPGLHDARGKLGLSIHLAVWQQNQVIAWSCNVMRIGQCTICTQGLNVLGQKLICSWLLVQEVILKLLHFYRMLYKRCVYLTLAVRSQIWYVCHHGHWVMSQDVNIILYLYWHLHKFLYIYSEVWYIFVGHIYTCSPAWRNTDSRTYIALMCVITESVLCS